MPVVFESEARFTDTGLDQLSQKIQELVKEADALEAASGGIETAGRELDTLGSKAGTIDRLSDPLRKLVQVGIEPIALVSPTAGRALSGLVEKLGGATLVVGALTGALATVGGVLAGLAGSFADAADELGKLSTRTGIAVANLAGLKLAADLGDSSLEEVTRSVILMQRAIDEAGQGTEAQVQAFERLGISLGELQTLTPEAQFESLARALVGIEDPTTRSAVAMEVLGRSGAQLLPVLEDLGTRGLKGLREETEQLGIAMTAQAAAQGADFNDTLTRIGLAVKGLAFDIGRDLVPIFTELGQVVLDGVLGFRQFLTESGLLDTGLNVLIVSLEVLRATLQVFGAILREIGDAFTFLTNSTLALQGALGPLVGTFAALGAASRGNVPTATTDLDALGVSAEAAAQFMEAFEQRARGAGSATAQSAAEARQALEDQARAAREAAQAAATIETAAFDRAQAELEASGNVLGAIENERRAKVAAIRQTIDAAEAGSAQRVALEQAALNQITALEIEAAQKRKAAISGFVGEAIGVLEGLGEEFDDLRQKLLIAQAMEANAAALNTFAELADAGKISAEDFLRVQEALTDQMEQLARGTLPAADSIKELGDAAATAEPKLQRLGTVRPPQLDTSGLTGPLDQLSREQLVEVRRQLEAVGAVQFTPELIAQLDATIAKLDETASHAENLGQTFTNVGSQAQLLPFATPGDPNLLTTERRAVSNLGPLSGQTFPDVLVRAVRALTESKPGAIPGGELFARAPRGVGRIGTPFPFSTFSGSDRNFIAGFTDFGLPIIGEANEIIQNWVQAQKDALDIQERISSLLGNTFETGTNFANTFATQFGGGFGGGGVSTATIPAPDPAGPFAPALIVPGFQQGGIVPGPRGRPRLVMAHGGEEVLPIGREPDPIVVININGTDVLEGTRATERLAERMQRILADRLRRRI
jgi:hypothetical protein